MEPLPGILAVGMAMATWLVLPHVLRCCHRYFYHEPIPYELGPDDGDSVWFHQSVFGALKDPARLFAAALTITYLFSSAATIW